MRLLIYILLSTFFISFFSCKKKVEYSPSESETLTSQNDYINTSVEYMDQLMASKPKMRLIDVRTPEEIEKGVIGQPLKFNFYDDQFKNQIAKLNKEIPYLVYCKKGGRSAKASKMMKNLGFKNVYNLKGGYDAYQKSRAQ